MHKNFAILFAFIFSSAIVYAQEFSPHYFDLQRHKNTPTTRALIGDRSQPIKPLQRRLAKTAAPTATVYGFLPYWIRDQSYSYLRFELLTHIAIFGIEVNADGSLGNAHGWPWNDVINKAHAAGTKIILTTTLFSGNDILTLIANPAYKQRFFDNVKSQILAGNADGVNIDFEGGRSSGWPGKINGFMAELTDFLHREIPGSEVSFAAPVINWGGDFNLPELANSCDYLFIMGYAFAGAWSTNSGPNSPFTGQGNNISSALNSDYAQVVQNTPERLILGLPYYGHHWKTSSANTGATTLEFIASTFFSTAQPGAETYGRIWHASSQTPWYRYHDGDNWHQVWFDDDSSLGLKYDFAMSKNLRGVGMWALGYDGSRPELWDLLDRKFGSGQQPPPAMPLSFRVLANDSTSLKIKFEPANRAEGYYIYPSPDGLTFADSIYKAENEFVLENLATDSLYFFRVRAVNSSGLSAPTEVLAGIPGVSTSPILIVNGFDRTAGTNNTFDFIRQHGTAIAAAERGFSSASNEAIYRDRLSLRQFAIVDWMLGDESTADDTFNATEQDCVMAFLDFGGALFVSGPEIGWDLVEKGSSTDQSFYQNYLKAEYVDDAPRGLKATYYNLTPIGPSGIGSGENYAFDNGSHGTFNIDWPDAIRPVAGSEFFMMYDGVDRNADGGAGVLFKGLFADVAADTGAVVYLAVPFETIYPAEKRTRLMADILDFLTLRKNMDNGEVLENFTLLQNYPNPFNRNTKIPYYLRQAGKVTLTIYNTRGQQVWKTKRTHSNSGEYKIEWAGINTAGLRLSSGVYFYRMRFEGENGETVIRRKKMSLLQ